MRLPIPSDLRQLLRTGLTRSVGSLAIKMGTAGLTYLTYVVLSRTMNEHEYGLFALGLALATVLAIGAAVGQPIAILRFWSEALAHGRKNEAETALRAGGGLTLLASAVLGLGLVLYALVLPALWPASGSSTHLLATALLLGPMALAEYNGSALRAQGSVYTALAPRDIVWRFAVPAAVLVLYAAFGVSLTGWQALLLSALLLVAALGGQYGWASARGYLLRPGLATIRPYWKERGTVSRWFLLGAIIDTVALNADTILVGLMVDAQSAGVYFNAFRTAGLMTLFGFAVTLVVAPMLAQHYHEGDRRKAQTITAACVWTGFVFALLFFAIFWVFGSEVLSLFGPGYGDAYPVLMILSFGLLVDAAVGPTRTVMMMTGHERAYVWTFGLLTATGLGVQALVLPHWGLLGAALVNVAARIASQLIIARWCITKAGIDPTILGLFKINRVATLSPVSASNRMA